MATWSWWDWQLVGSALPPAGGNTSFEQQVPEGYSVQRIITQGSIYAAAYVQNSSVPLLAGHDYDAEFNIQVNDGNDPPITVFDSWYISQRTWNVQLVGALYQFSCQWWLDPSVTNVDIRPRHKMKTSAGGNVRYYFEVNRVFPDYANLIEPTGSWRGQIKVRTLLSRS